MVAEQAIRRVQEAADVWLAAFVARQEQTFVVLHNRDPAFAAVWSLVQPKPDELGTVEHVKRGNGHEVKLETAEQPRHQTADVTGLAAARRPVEDTQAAETLAQSLQPWRFPSQEIIAIVQAQLLFTPRRYLLEPDRLSTGLAAAHTDEFEAGLVNLGLPVLVQLRNDLCGHLGRRRIHE
jgi:hypothetical protein